MSLSFCQYQLYKPIGSYKDFSCPSSQVSASWLNGNDCSIATATFTCALHQSERKEAVQAVASCYLQCETTQQNVYRYPVSGRPTAILGQQKKTELGAWRQADLCRLENQIT